MQYRHCICIGRRKILPNLIKLAVLQNRPSENKGANMQYRNSLHTDGRFRPVSCRYKFSGDYIEATKQNPADNSQSIQLMDRAGDQDR